MPVPFSFIQALTQAPPGTGPGDQILMQGLGQARQGRQFERQQTEVERAAQEREAIQREQEAGRMNRAAMVYDMQFRQLANRYAQEAAQEKQDAIMSFYAAAEAGKPVEPHVERLRRSGVTATLPEAPTQEPLPQAPTEAGVPREEEEGPELPDVIEPKMRPGRAPIDPGTGYPDDWTPEDIARAQETPGIGEVMEAEGMAPQAIAQATGQAPAGYVPPVMPAQGIEPETPFVPKVIPPAMMREAAQQNVPTPEERAAQMGIEPSLAGDLGPGGYMLTDDITGETMAFDRSAYVADRKKRAVAKYQHGFKPIGPREQSVQQEGARMAESYAGDMDADEANAKAIEWTRWRLGQIYAGERAAEQARARRASAGAQFERLELQRNKHLNDYISKKADNLGYSDALEKLRQAQRARNLMGAPEMKDNPIAQQVAIGAQVKAVQGGRPSDYDTRTIKHATGLWDEMKTLINKIKLGDEAGTVTARYQEKFLEMTRVLEQAQRGRLEIIARRVKHSVDRQRVFDKVHGPGGAGRFAYDEINEGTLATTPAYRGPQSPDIGAVRYHHSETVPLDEDDVDALLEREGL